MKTCTPKTSRRELGKGRRRDAIVQSACELLRRIAYADMSVAMIAEGAGLSTATVFNLFGSKSAVLEAVVERDSEAVQRRILDRRGADGLELMFDAARLMADRYRRNAPAYRNALAAQARIAARTEQTFWLRLVRTAMIDGDLGATVDSVHIAKLLTYLQTGALVQWLAGAISSDQFESDVVRGMAAVLAPYATAKGRRQLAGRSGAEPQRLIDDERPAHEGAASRRAQQVAHA